MNTKNILPISVLIPTMNRAESLKRTLLSYLSASHIPAQIVVVDQSRDEMSKSVVGGLITEFPEVDIEYIYQKVPSTTLSRNTAMSRAENDILVFSDDDIDVYGDTLKKLYNLMVNERIAMIAGLNDEDNGKTSSIGYLWGTKSFMKRHKGYVTKSMLGRYPDRVVGQVETEWAMGYFFSVKKSLLEKWSICWDEKMTSYAYAEDLDLTYSYYKKAKKEGLECLLDEDIHVRHLVSKEYRVPTIKSTYAYVLNRAYLSYKHKMGICSRIAMAWCDFGKIIEKTIKKEKPEDLISARRYLRKHKKEIKQGIFNGSVV